MAWIETVCLYYAGTYRVMLACDDAPQIVTGSRAEALAACGEAGVARAERGARWVLTDGATYTVLPHDWLEDRPPLVRTTERAEAVAASSEEQVAAAERDLELARRFTPELFPPV